MELWVLLLKAEQEIDKLVSSQIGMWQLIWTIQTRKCFILCHQALDLGCILVLWRGQHLLSQMTFGMAYLPEQTQVMKFLAMVVDRTYVHLCWKIVSMSYSLSLKVFLEDRGKEGYQLVLVQPSCRYKSPLFCMN